MYVWVTNLKEYQLLATFFFSKYYWHHSVDLLFNLVLPLGGGCYRKQFIDKQQLFNCIWNLSCLLKDTYYWLVDAEEKTRSCACSLYFCLFLVILVQHSVWNSHIALSPMLSLCIFFPMAVGNFDLHLVGFYF